MKSVFYILILWGVLAFFSPTVEGWTIAIITHRGLIGGFLTIVGFMLLLKPEYESGFKIYTEGRTDEEVAKQIKDHLPPSYKMKKDF